MSGGGDEWQESARAAWPGVEVAPEVFAAYVGERGAPKFVVDLYLACALGRGDPRALVAFEDHVLSVVDGALRRLGLSADHAVEVKQRLRASLLCGDGAGGRPKIEQFSGRGDLRGWVRVIAVREALALVERDARLDPLDGDDRLVESLLPDGDPELDYLKRTYRSEFRAAFDEALRGLEDRERLLLRQQFIDRLTLEEIGGLFRVHHSTAARWLERARARVMELTLARLRLRLRVGPAELESILRLIQSQIDVSMAGIR